MLSLHVGRVGYIQIRLNHYSYREISPSAHRSILIVSGETLFRAQGARTLSRAHLETIRGQLLISWHKTSGIRTVTDH